MSNRAILHLDLDALPVSVECLRDASLRGRPLIIIHAGGGPVVSCSREACAFGIQPLMPLRMALRLCPDATILRGDMEAYARHSQVVTDLIDEQAPVFEKSSLSEFYLDLTGMDRYFGCWRWAQELRRRIVCETGLPLTAALSVNKLVAKVGAGEAEPNTARLIDPGTEKQFLAPLPVRKLPAIAAGLCRKLNFMGVRRIDTLSRISPELLRQAFGAPGPELWKKANAIDEGPVVPYVAPQVLSAERPFADTMDMRFLLDQLSAMVSELAFELRRRRRLASCVSVKLRYADLNTYSRRRRMSPTASDRELVKHAHKLLEELYQRRQLVRLVGMSLEQLVSGYTQLSLFEEEGEEVRLTAAMDEIRKRFGRGAVGRCSSF